MVAPRQKQKKIGEQEFADRVKNLKRLQTREALPRSQIAKLELNLQQHKDMLQEVLLQIQTVGDEASDLRALMAQDDAPVDVVPVVAATSPVKCDSQQSQGGSLASIVEVK